MVANEEEPVASPGDVTSHLAITRNFNFHIGGEAIARNIIHSDFAARVQDGANGSDWCLDAVLAGLDAIQKGEGRDEANGAVTAHAEIADIVKEDDASCAGGIDRVAKQRANDYVGTARFVDDGRTKTIVLAAKALQALGKRAGAEIGATAYNEARGFASSVGVDDMNFAGGMGHHSYAWNFIF